MKGIFGKKSPVNNYEDIDTFLSNYSSNNYNYNDTNKIFQKTNNIQKKMSTQKVARTHGKDPNYQLVNTNYISSNGTGGLQNNSIIPHIAFNNKDKNNVSMLSSSTNDSNMEIILENVPSITNKQLIKAGPRANVANNKYASLNGNYNYLNNVATLPPGQIVPYQSVNNVIVTKTSEKNAKRLTQGIVAIAAQRKAYNHHKQLMQELNDSEPSSHSDEKLTPSRLAKHDQVVSPPNNKYGARTSNVFDYDEKKNYGAVLNESNGTSYGGKAKKQVKIQEIVQFKLPDDDIDIRKDSFEYSNSQYQQQAKQDDKPSKKANKNNARRSKCKL